MSVDRREAQKVERHLSRSKIESLGEANNYQHWRHVVPQAVRGIIESKLKGTKSGAPITGFIHVDEFLGALHREFHAPELVEPAMTAYLRSVEQEDGSFDALATLTNPETSFAVRTQIYDQHIRPVLEYYQALDREELQKREEEVEKKQDQTHEQEQDDVPPPPGASISPTMDEMENGEGEPRALYRVSPFWGGYYAEERCDTWDEKTFSWVQSKKTTPSRLTDKIVLDALASREISGKMRLGQPLAVPLPPGWMIDPASLNVEQSTVQVFETRDGSVRLESTGDGVVLYTAQIGPHRTATVTAPSRDRQIAGTGPTIPKELAQCLNDVKKSTAGSMAKARLIVKAVRERLEYSNDSSFNAAYRTDTVGYVERVWENKKADCDVANTVALFALQNAGIPARIIGGHYVKGKMKDGSAALHGGTRHAWLEVWDDQEKQWKLADATPKGDPNMDEERPDESQETGEGNYGEKEAEIMSDEELEQLIKKLKQNETTTPPKQFSADDREAALFAKKAECTLKQAKEIQEAFLRVREMKDAQSNPLGEMMVAEWQKLVTSRLVSKRVYRGPVRRSEGDVLDDPTIAWVDIQSGDPDPSGFEQPVYQEKREKLFGGLDVYLLLDLSGSMHELDPVTQRIKAELQRDFALLYADTLMQCAFLSRTREEELDAPMPIRLQIVSIHGNASVDLPLTGQWTAKEQFALYNAVHADPSNGTPDDQALELIEARIEAERELWKKNTHEEHEKPPIEFVAVCLDGGSNDPQKARNIANRLRGGGAVVYGYGMTAAARGIEATYAPHAKIVVTLEQHAEIVAADTISVFRKLYPERIEEL